MNEKPLYIKNAKIVPGNGSRPLSGDAVISYKDGKGYFSYIGRPQSSEKSGNCSVFNVEGMYMLPAFTDIGCRFYDPRHPSRDSIASSSTAALSSGFLTLLCEPCTDGEKVSKNIIVGSDCRIIPASSPKKPSDIAENGRNIYSDNGHWITDPVLMRETMLACASTDSLFISTCIDPRLAGDGVINPGKTARLLGLPTVPVSAEATAAARDILLAGETGCRLHIRTVSCESTVDLIRYAKKSGINVTCGTSALYYSMKDSDIFYYGGSAKVMPPLRTSKDVKAVIKAITDGTVDCISSLHTPLTKSENCPDLRSCLFGASGFDIALPAFITYIIKTGIGSYDLLARLFSLNPSKIAGFDSSLRVGGNADFVLIDPDTEIVISSNSMKSKAVNTPFFGMTLNGRVKSVFSNGVKV